MKNQLNYSDLHYLLHALLGRPFHLHLQDDQHTMVLDIAPKELASNWLSQHEANVLFCTGSKPHARDGVHAEDIDLLIDWESKRQLDMPDYTRQLFYYVCNTDGSLRWVYPAGNPQPSYLQFYYSGNLKSKLVSTLARKAHQLGIGKQLKGGCFSLYCKEPLLVKHHVADLNLPWYSIFMGTPGPNRKLLIEYNRGGAAEFFVKVPLSRQTAVLGHSERDAIHQVQSLKLAATQVPHVLSMGNKGWVTLSNVAREQGRRVSKFGNKQALSLSEQYHASLSFFRIGEMSYYRRIKSRLSLLEADKRLAASGVMIGRMQELMALMDTETVITCAFAHGDYTPWNMYELGNRLGLYDFELAQRGAPLLYDLFHYHMQDGILIGRQNFQQIYRRIEQELTRPVWQKMISRYEVDVRLYFMLYLLDVISYYLRLYAKQAQLHEQVSWLVATWQEALQAMQHELTSGSYRERMVKDLMQLAIKEKAAVLKWDHNSPDELAAGSDLDLAVHKASIPSFIVYTRQHPLVRRVKVCQKSYMVVLELYLRDGGYLSIDLLHELRRKDRLLMPFHALLESAVATAHDVPLPSKHFDFEYCWLFYQSNGSDIPERYQKHYLAQSYYCKERILLYINGNYGTGANSLEQLMAYSAWHHTRIKRYTTQFGPNRGLSRMRQIVTYLRDSWATLRRNQGFSITLSGVDGVGKSTIISALEQQLAEVHRRPVKVLRHRPSVLPILSALLLPKSKVNHEKLSQPHAGTNRNRLSSLLRFAYYLTDYLIGQFYIMLRYHARGYLVLYDRYYFDMIYDMKRSNLIISRKLARKCYALLLKPKVNIFLHAPSKLILKRKQELTAPVIETLTTGYMHLFAELARKSQAARYASIENIHKEATIRQILQEINAAV